MSVHGRWIRAFAWVAALTLAIGIAPSEATTVRQLNIVDLIGHAQTILAGRVEQVTDGIDASGVPYTEVTLKVIDPIRGTQGEHHTFRQFGLAAPRTLADGHVYLGGRPEGWPTWNEGEVALIFLYAKARVTGLQTTVGLGYGKLGLGNAAALNGFNNAGLFENVRVDPLLLTTAEKTMLSVRQGPVNAETLRNFVRRAVKGDWVRKGSLANEKR